MTDVRVVGWPCALLVIGGLALASLTTAAVAQQQTVSREQDIGELRLGQKILVDDGSCPAGQILEVTGANLTANGVTRVRKCVPRRR
ncbi:hypothetical protein LPW26_07220 [Rhodopseudomonas sp. HC1]|uniref:DUF6719 family protein n=1 Tax=Rhodopseudomonas infernalis TaxID=2897386 RepID=UPI001EE7EF89|nr:DUF6719 family protein [Rhodopseudomonas infernalis]MCG6204419.1 hypothetical protein [Rhodopseudomonas infernalis]